MSVSLNRRKVGTLTDSQALDSVFSGEEAYGKHLDLYLSHTQYLNLKGSSRLSYFGYLDMLRQGKVERTLDVKEKSLPAYLEYVQTLYNYLVSFFDRALPLTDIHQKIKEEEEKFETAWAAGQVEGWESEGKKAAPVGEGIWCPFCEFTWLLSMRALLIGRSEELLETDCLRCPPERRQAQEEGESRCPSRRSNTSSSSTHRIIIVHAREDASTRSTHLPCPFSSHHRTYPN